MGMYLAEWSALWGLRTGAAHLLTAAPPRLGGREAGGGRTKEAGWRRDGEIDE